MSGKDKFNKYIYIINAISLLINIMPNICINKLWNFINNWSGKLGIVLRYCILKTKSKSCGDNVFIGKNVYINCMENLSCGDNVSIHPNSYIDATGNIYIGDNVSIAHSTSILSSNHTWVNKSIPIKYNELSLKPVIIKSDVWVGCGVRILAGSIINKRVVIAAGSVVNKTIKSNTLVGGIPAREIKVLD